MRRIWLISNCFKLTVVIIQPILCDVSQEKEHPGEHYYIIQTYSAKYLLNIKNK